VSADARHARALPRTLQRALQLAAAADRRRPAELMSNPRDTPCRRRIRLEDTHERRPYQPLLRQRLREYHRIDEAQVVEELIALARFTPPSSRASTNAPHRWCRRCATAARTPAASTPFLATYDLSSREGVVLMCLAEALLRIPDSATVDRLIRDKIGNTEWEKRLGASHSTFVNAGTWALMLTGRIVNLDNDDRNLGGTLKRLVARAGEPVIRQAVITAMRILGKQFVMGRNIHEALERARSAERPVTATPTTCSANRRAAAPTPCATSSPTARRSGRSATPRPAGRLSRRRRSRSSSRRCTRATKSPTRIAFATSCCRRSRRWRCGPRRATSASRSTPRKSIGWKCRST
jgi:hypothetical protein